MESDYKLRDVVALKKVDQVQLVVPDANGTISYRQQNWRAVPARVETTLTSNVLEDSTTISVDALDGIVVGGKLRIDSLYEGVVTGISGLNVTLDTPAPTAIPAGRSVLGGALVEGAKYVYLVAYLEYDNFPIVTYRQVGLCTGVTPNTSDILRSAEYSSSGANEYSSLGVLEILDNRVPARRDANQREAISMIIEL